MSKKFSEDFDPAAYKSHEDLPTKEKDKFVPAGEGFVRKEAHEKFEEAKEIAKIISQMESRDVSPIDVLHNEALVDIEKKETALSQIKSLLMYKYNLRASPTSNYYQYESYLYNLDKSFESLPEEVLSKEFFLETIKSGNGGNRELINLIVKYIPLKLRNDQDLFLAVAEYSDDIQYASEELWGDKELVLKAAKVNSKVLEYVSPELQADKEVVLAAVKRSGDQLRFASPELRNDREVVLASIGRDLSAFSYASPELRADKEFVMQAVTQGCSLKNVSEKLRGDKDVVLVAIGHRGEQIKYASDELKRDEEVVLKSIEKGNSGYNGLYYISSDLLNNKNFVLKAAKVSTDIIERIPKQLLADKEVIAEIILANRGGDADIKYAAEELKSDSKFILDLLEKGAKVKTLRDISPDLKADYKFVLEAVKINPEALRYIASPEIIGKVNDLLKNKV